MLKIAKPKLYQFTNLLC